jgi:DNA-binding Lrp family transcriptional regulator
MGLMPNATPPTAFPVALRHGLTDELDNAIVIRGFHADVSLAAMGRPVQALIAIRLAAHTRDQIDDVRRTIPALPGVLAMFHVSGVNDYLIHVAVADTDALREFLLDHVTSQPGVAHAETSLIFEHVGAEDPLALGAELMDS